MIDFFAFLFACAFGFGLAFWIAATVLNNSNNFGDYHAEASHYSASVNITNEEKLKSQVGRESYVGESHFTKPTIPSAPKGKELIQKPAPPRIHHSGQNAVSSKALDPKTQVSTAVLSGAPQRKDSSFPRSFHDV